MTTMTTWWQLGGRVLKVWGYVTAVSAAVTLIGLYAGGAHLERWRRQEESDEDYETEIEAVAEKVVFVVLPLVQLVAAAGLVWTTCLLLSPGAFCKMVALIGVAANVADHINIAKALVLVRPCWHVFLSSFR